MRVLRHASLAATALVLSIGAAAHASGRHSDDSATYYGQTTALHASGHTNALHRQVIATESKNVYLFAPKSIKVKVGTRVTWANKADVAHNVTFDKNTKVNMDIKVGKSVSYTFTKVGVFTYHCEYHPYMKGTVTVTR